MHKWTVILRKIAKWVTSGFVLSMLATVALAVATFFLVQPLTLEHLAHAQVKANPFTLQLESYDFSEGPGGTLFAKQTIARRSDGATVQVGIVFGSVGLAAGETARHISFPNGQTFTVFDGIASVVRLPQLSMEALTLQKKKLLNPPANCILPGETLVGYGTIGGYKVAVKKIPPIADRVVTAWDAPELGCEALQYRVEVREPDGSTKLATETKQVSLNIGEPDSRLFDIPESYANITPSEVMHKEAAHLGIQWTNDLQHEADRRDSVYFGRVPSRSPTP